MSELLPFNERKQPISSEIPENYPEHPDFLGKGTEYVVFRAGLHAKKTNYKNALQQLAHPEIDAAAIKDRMEQTRESYEEVRAYFGDIVPPASFDTEEVAIHSATLSKLAHEGSTTGLTDQEKEMLQTLRSLFQ